MLSGPVAQRLEALQPDTTAHLQRINQLSREGLDGPLFALCEGCLDAALRGELWRPPAGGLDERQRAFIDFTEQFASSVSTLQAEQVSRLLDFASADEVYGFVHALYVADMTRRLELVAGEVLA